MLENLVTGLEKGHFLTWVDSVGHQTVPALGLAPAVSIVAQTLVAIVVAVALLSRETAKYGILGIGTAKDHLLPHFLQDPQPEAWTAQRAMMDQEIDVIHQHGVMVDHRMGHVLQDVSLLRNQWPIEHRLLQKWTISGGLK